MWPLEQTATVLPEDYEFGVIILVEVEPFDSRQYLLLEYCGVDRLLQ